MKRIASVIFAICIALGLGAQENEVLKTLYGYLGTIAESPMAAKITEVDYIMGVAAQSPDSALVARTVFTWFKESPVMGDESVALHVYDRWMAPACPPEKGGADAFTLAARLWAELNRSSMIGCKAPHIAFEALDGSYVELFGSDRLSRPAILYFYDTSCSKCREEAPLVAQTDFSGADVFAIYTGTSLEEWTGFIERHWSGCGMIHLWDPNATSDKEVKYAVIGTPRMFLVNVDGLIAGRMLDPSSAHTLLDAVIASNDPYSGLGEARRFLDYVFMAMGDTISRDDISMVRNLIRVKALEKDRDTLAYRQLTAAMMQSLIAMRGAGPYEGMLDLCREDVLGAPEGIWTNQADSLQVVEPARLFLSVRDKCRIGEKLPRLRVKTSKGRKNLARCRNAEVIFYTPRCSSCMEIISKVSHDAILVDVDEQTDRISNLLPENIDLSILPMIFRLDGKGRITARALNY